MIEDYIEKDIIRQVKLTEYLYDLKILYVKEVAKRLNVTFNTIKRDFSKITAILADYIEYSEITSTTIVSYTHLDVYKRQDYKLCVVNNKNKNYMVPNIITLIAFSYTHLDVYKRQIWYLILSL
ncbi:hypothetical protein A5812_002633 [Enterococcus faecium]|uniref:helix-turn-helix domain-containing protein n=1 Tax=Enterococcus faecium TaxID=1352 RepID=UPI000A342FA4|nr:helix-turn-helix domain-containing protein [Enterococcus faecium]OTO57147.1 hypothetical protein A5812_002633 [Enterococcus faecium]